MFRPLAINVEKGTIQIAAVIMRGLFSVLYVYILVINANTVQIYDMNQAKRECHKNTQNTKLSHVIELDQIKNNDILLTQTPDCSSLSDLMNMSKVYMFILMIM